MSVYSLHKHGKKSIVETQKHLRWLLPNRWCQFSPLFRIFSIFPQFFRLNPISCPANSVYRHLKCSKFFETSPNATKTIWGPNWRFRSIHKQSGDITTWLRFWTCECCLMFYSLLFPFRFGSSNLNMCLNSAKIFSRIIHNRRNVRLFSLVCFFVYIYSVLTFRFSQSVTLADNRNAPYFTQMKCIYRATL